MLLKITGDTKDIAHSAWISTINEMVADAKSEAEIERVVNFLIDNHHSSPLECVTLTFESSQDGDLDFAALSSKYSRYFGDKIFTIDLLNFIKEIKKKDMFGSKMWLLFEKLRPRLSVIIKKFGLLLDTPSPAVDNLLGDHGMDVELVLLHDSNDNRHARATWRVKCPLSIAVQILRHRDASYNMVSGRYRTIKQEMIGPAVDCDEIMNKMGIDLASYLDSVKPVVQRYLDIMKSAKHSKDDGVISNEEYKRLREFARFVLPEGRMTELYVTCYLDTFYDNFLKLRNSVHAQTEHIWVAQEMQKTLEKSRQ